MLKFLHRIGLVLPYVLFLVAAWIVHRQVTAHPLREIVDSMRDMPPGLVLIACVLTVLNYTMLSGYDWLGVKYAGHKVPYRRILIASLIGYAISNNTGHALVTGTSVRYRFYNAAGVPGWDILKIAVFSALTFVIAAFTLEAGLSLFMPDAMKQGQNAPTLVHGATLLSAAGLGIYWSAVLLMRGPLRIKSYEFRMPTPSIALMQTGIGVAEMILSAVILYIFLSVDSPMPFAGFLAIYVLALLAGLISQVPGGLGVFEGAFIWLAGPEFSSADILSALVMYRIVYYFLPLALAALGMFFYELRHHGERLVRGSPLLSSALDQSLPAIFSILLFFCGALLLISGVTPARPEHIEILGRYLPLIGIEFAHLTASLAGVVLLLMARAVRLRIRPAWAASLTVLTIGAAAALLRDLDWKEDIILLFMILILLPSKRHFDGHGSILTIPMNRGWAAMIASVLIVSCWVGFFAYHHVEYANSLWWQFSYKGDAPRFLRALLLTFAVVAGYGLYRFMSGMKRRGILPPTPEELDRARSIARGMNTTDGFLVLLGDKNLIWSDDGSSFIMYAMTPAYWIAMGDPVGNPETFDTLAWKFRETADRHGAQAVFYQVSDRHLPLYLDLGMVMVKIGEEARVPLASFSLVGGKRENQRKGRNRFLKQGYTMRFLDPQELESRLPRLREISDAWLAQKNIREKRFSLGFFDESYLHRTRIAVVEHEGAVLAFANFWDLDNRAGLAIDLMRYAPEAPPNMMEFLFVELILWGQAEGYAWFSLGMAPLSGLEKHPLAPLWHKIGNVIFEHGEEFYNFEGLHAYKAKFDPEWHPRYLAAPSGLRIPMVLMNIASVISGGLQGVFKKDNKRDSTAVTDDLS